MSETPHDAALPRVPLVGAITLVLATILVVAGVRITGIGVATNPDAPAVEVRAFHFEDRPDGSIAVLDAGTGEPVATIAPGTNGFLRGTLRGLARERKRRGLGPEQAFRLIGRADGRLTLEDPATGRRVDLESFGPTNAAVFSRLLLQPPSSHSAAPTVLQPAS